MPSFSDLVKQKIDIPFSPVTMLHDFQFSQSTKSPMSGGNGGQSRDQTPTLGLINSSCVNLQNCTLFLVFVQWQVLQLF